MIKTSLFKKICFAMATLALVNGISITSVNAMENDESSQEAETVCG